MGLKILHSADWHLDSPFASFPEQQREFLRRELRKLPGKVTDVCRREGCDMMLLSGDLFDGEATRESVEILKAALKECGVPVLISPGNHDFCAPGSPWLEERWPENVYVFTGNLEAVAIPELNCRVYGAGYRSMDCPGLLEGFRAEATEAYSVAVLHGDATKADSPYCPVTAAQVRGSGLDYLALGHVHKAGAFRAGATLCAWPGSPMGRGWDETGERGVCIVTLGEEADIRAVSLDTPRFYELEAEIGEDAAAALEALLPGAGSKDFYRITLTGCGEVDLAELKRRFSAVPNLELRDKTEPPIDLWAEAGTDTLEGTFFRRLKEMLEDSPGEKERILLAAEISRRILDGREVPLP